MDLPPADAASAADEDPLRGFSIDDDDDVDDLVDEDVAAFLDTAAASASASASAPAAGDAPAPATAATSSASGADATASLLRSNQEGIVAEAMSHLNLGGGESTSPAANGQPPQHSHYQQPHYQQQQQQQQHPLAPSVNPMSPSPQHGGGGASSAAGSLAARIGGGPSWYENAASLARRTATTLQDAAGAAGTAVAHAAAQAEGAVSHLDQQVGASPQPYRFLQQQNQTAAHSSSFPRQPMAAGGGQATTAAAAMAPPPSSGLTPSSSSTPSSSLHGQQPSSSLPEMDNATKSALLASALEGGGGDSLLPGERVIMFLTHLSHVRDSAGTNTGIGTDYDLMSMVGSGDRTGGSLASMFPPSAATEQEQGQSSKKVVWCCVMTFYRVILFSYRECDFPGTIPDGTASDSGSTGNATTGESCGEPNSDDCSDDQASNAVLDEVVRTASVSRQYQLAQDWARRRRPRHHLLQMPLASIDRVERVPQYTYSGGALSTAQVPYGTTGTTLGLTLYGKDNRYLRFSPNHADALRAYEALQTYAFPGRKNLGYLFAFESRRTEVMASIQKVDQTNGGGAATTGAAPQQPTQQIITARCTTRRYEAQREFDRLGILAPRETTGSASPWKTIRTLNSTYTLCPSYPSVFVGPSRISDDSADGQRILRRVAAFRSEGRMPVLTWGNSVDGASIWRSSQPRVGLQGNRSSADEQFLRSIAECAESVAVPSEKARQLLKIPGRSFLQTLVGGNNEDDLLINSAPNGRPPVGLKIMDLRPKSSAVANRTQGYGYENTSYYIGCDISFHGIGNIHAVRDSYQKISSLCQSPSTNDVQWAQNVEETKWLSHVRLILSASWQTAFHVRYNRLPVLLHCSHGWDRTSQVAALAQLLLDGYYRTKIGFSVLIEKDFMAFGHPFHTRCGHGMGKGERGGVAAGQVGGGGDEGQLSPIFIQFLDCCFQLVNQYPEYFEFNAEYLLILSEHVYSCRFGTLLCDTERERELVAGIRQRTHCLWEYLDSRDDLTNPGYYKEADTLMMPLPTLLRNVTLWVDRHCMYGPKPTVRCLAPPVDELCRSVSAGVGTGTVTDDDSDGGVNNTMPTAFAGGSQTTMQWALAQAEQWRRVADSRQREIIELKKKLELKD